MRFDSQIRQSNSIQIYNEWQFGLSGSDQKPPQSSSDPAPDSVHAYLWY